MTAENLDENVPPDEAEAHTPPEPAASHPPDAAAELPAEEDHGDEADHPHVDGAEAELAAAAMPALPESKHWYIVKVQSGREESIRGAIERRVKIEGLEEYFGGIKVPMERV